MGARVGHSFCLRTCCEGMSCFNERAMKMIQQMLKAYYNYFFPPRYPLGGCVYLNNTCNLKCFFCEIGQLNRQAKSFTRKTELAAEEIDKLINLCSKAKINSLYVTGGEPFWAKIIWYLLRKCRNSRVSIEAITTNGTLLGELRKSDIDLINAVTEDIAISIDSAREEFHDESRGVPGTFGKIRSFLISREKRSLFKNSFSFNVVVHSRNIGELKDIIDLAAEWHIDHINFQPVCPEAIFVDIEKVSDKSCYIEGLDARKVSTVLKEAIEYARNKGVSTDLQVLNLWAPYYFEYLGKEKFFFEVLPAKFLCASVFNYIRINYNGDLIPCTNLKPVANINDDSCFEKWQVAVQKLKSLFKKGKYFYQCKYCFCDFPVSLRLSLLYFPFKNASLLLRLLNYYLCRMKAKRLV